MLFVGHTRYVRPRPRPPAGPPSLPASALWVSGRVCRQQHHAGRGDGEGSWVRTTRAHGEGLKHRADAACLFDSLHSGDSRPRAHPNSSRLTRRGWRGRRRDWRICWFMHMHMPMLRICTWQGALPADNCKYMMLPAVGNGGAAHRIARGAASPMCPAAASSRIWSLAGR